MSIETSTAGTSTAGAATETAPPQTAPVTATEKESAETVEDVSEPPAAKGPESVPGGAGDEIEASAQAELTGRGGQIRPRRVRVPPFIAVRVELRSADGRTYELSSERGKRVYTDRDIERASARFKGLRPGERLVLKGPQGDVLIEPSAEPGP